MRKDPKDYMKLAVEVMKKSIHERKKDDPSPYVGAVLVFPDGTVETAYRGEFREGDHAEYTLLEKKNRDRVLTGCWLFATLEPCAPGARNAPKSNEFLQELKEMELLEYDEGSGAYQPTGNAILLFGKSPRNKFPQAAVKAKVDYGNGKTGSETFSDALVFIPDQVEEWLNKVLPSSIDRSKFKAQKVPAFPTSVIREAIINAIAHRDYELDGAKTQLEVYPNRIVVKSPGKPILPITIEALKNFTATSYSRNKKITFVFNEMQYMEESAIGMDTFRSLREKFNLPLPAYDYDGINTVLVFPRTTEAIREVINKEPIKELDEDELLIFEIFRNYMPITKIEFAKQAGLANRTAERILKRFADLNLIKRRGSGPSTDYVINE